MLARPIRASLENRGFVAALAVALAGFGVWSFFQQPIDAYPDISGQVVTVISTYPGRAPEEVERQVTIPVELAMGNIPRLDIIRSRTIFGLSVVQLIFEEGVESYFARQRVQEKLDNVQFPDGVVAELGPLATAYGEVYRYELENDGAHDIMEVRTLNDWVVVPRLQRTPGVAEVINFGGREKQYTVTLDPGQLERFGLTLANVIEAIQSNNANAGGSVLRRGSMSFVIRGRGSLQNIEDIEATVINTIEGTPVYVRDVGAVVFDSRPPSGLFARDRVDESVEGIVLMRRGENPSQVLNRVKEEVGVINAEYLPKGIRISPFYDRSFLVDSTLHTVAHSIGTGIALVLLVLLAFMGSPAMAFLVVLTIPFSLLFALVLMYLTRIPIGLLSLGAIDFGILVDGTVIMADSIALHLAKGEEQFPRPSVGQSVLAAAVSVERAIFYSMLMIIGAYLPLLTLSSIEGLLFRPMALTAVFALLGAAVFSLLLLPALSTIVLRKGYTDWDNPFVSRLRSAYGHVIRTFLARPKSVAVAVLAVAALIVAFVVPKLGFEFLPYLDEGVIWVRANFPEGTSLEQTAEFGKKIREFAMEYPEVQTVVAQSGRNDSGTDPFPPSRLEMMIVPTPRDEWEFHTKQEFLAALGKKLRDEFPTTRFNFTQPIIDSVTEDTNGTSANLAIELSGSNSDELLKLGRQTVEVVRKIRGATDVNIEQEGPQPQLIIQPDRARCARYDVKIEDVNQLINTALGGEPVGFLYEGERRFDIVVKFGREFMNSPQAIGRLPVYSSDDIPIPLSQVAKFDLADGQTMIARDSGRRRITVRCDIVGRDQGGFVAEAQKAFEKEVKVPESVQVRWLGMFENLQRAGQHFLMVIPVTIVVIFSLLYLTFHSPSEAALVLLSVPFAFLGGVVALSARGMTFNVSSGAGFAALFGVSIMNGVLMVEWIDAFRRRGMPLNEAIVQGSLGCFRPVLMASLVAILGLLPASIANGLGSDIQRPLATVIVWGLMSSTILTLFVVPVLYRLVDPKISMAGHGAPAKRASQEAGNSQPTL